MNEYTDSVSRAGSKNFGTDDRRLFLVEFGELVMQAWTQTVDYGDELTHVRNITQGKADTFPIIGRKRDATEHEPGQIILGGEIEHNEVEITLDKILVEAVFIPEIDELMNHFDLRAPYAKQIGESLAVAYCKRIARMHILASRVTERQHARAPLPNGYFTSDIATDPADLEQAAFAGIEWIRRWDIGGGPVQYRIPHQQYLLLAKYSALDSTMYSGSANRAQGTIGALAGLTPKPTNNIPRSNVTTGLPKYQGNFSATVGHISNSMAVGTLARRGLKVVMKDQEDRLGTLLIGSKLNGHGILRPECAFEVASSDITGVRGDNHPDKDKGQDDL